MCGVSWSSSFIFLHVAVQISLHHLLKRLFFSILCSCLLCHILIDHRDLSLFLGSLFYVPVFMPVPGCFDYRGLVIQFDIRYCDLSCFLSQNCCSYSGSFMVPCKFLKCLFYICEICHGYSNRDCIEPINHFG